MIGKITTGNGVAQGINNQQEKNKSEESTALERIAAKRAIDGKDSANLLIADSLQLQISSLGQGIQNANEAIGLLQIADAALTSQSETTGRLNELSIAFSNPALNADQRAVVQSEADALTSQMKQAVSEATYNGKNVFSGSLSFVTGAEVVEASLISPNVDALDFTDQDSLDAFMSQINSARSSVSGAINQMETLVTEHLNAMTNLTESESKLQNNDVTENLNELNAAILKENAGLFVQSHNYSYLQLKANALLA